MVSALRGTGLVQPGVIVQMLTVLLNTLLAPVLIAGWGTHHPLGVAGAGLASTVAILCGNVFLAIYFVRKEHYVALHPGQWRPHAPTLKRILGIGLPAGGEFFMMVLIMVAIYWTIAHFGDAAQAGFGIGYRVMQAFFLPVLAIAFAAAPLAGQSFGARQPERVRQTLHVAVTYSTVCMLAVTVLCWWRAPPLVAFFSGDPQVIKSGALYLEIGAWNAVASGVIFCCSSLFQAMGNTWPSLVSSASRILTFMLPAVVLVSWVPGFQLQHLWYLSVTSVLLQLLVSVILLRRELHRRLQPLQIPVAGAAPGSLATDGSVH
jgi:putative MATE family efflux protein